MRRNVGNYGASGGKWPHELLLLGMLLCLLHLVAQVLRWRLMPLLLGMRLLELPLLPTRRILHGQRKHWACRHEGRWRVLRHELEAFLHYVTAVQTLRFALLEALQTPHQQTFRIAQSLAGITGYGSLA